MGHSVLKSVAAASLSGVFLVGCASLNPFAEPDPRWADFKSWTNVTEGTEPTGDPSGLLQVVHKGPDGYRNVYVNDIAEATLLGEGPYDFPVGSVIVKEQFDNKADWEAGTGAGLTISVKAADDGTRNAGNWIWSAGFKAKAGQSEFCASCHTAAVSLEDSDFVFTTANFLKKHEAK